MHKSDLRLILSASPNIDANLAAERCLLDAVEPDGEILFLYQNDPAVVIGRFQNPWKECRTGLLRRTGTPLRRRISGGGTVVHGPGNLNWSVIAGRKSPQKNENLDRVIGALGKLGLPLRRNERCDLLLDTGLGERKIAGSAFRQTAGGSLHHATLLVNADLDFLRGLLDVPRRDISGRGVDSMRASVANLAERRPDITVEAAAEAIAGGWGAGRDVQLECLDPAELLDAAGPAGPSGPHYQGASDEWNWGRTPPFTERFKALAGFGDAALILHVVQGRIASVDSTGAAGSPGAQGEQGAQGQQGASGAPGEQGAPGEKGAPPTQGAPSEDLHALIGCPYHGDAVLERLAPRGNRWAAQLAARVDGDT